MAKRIKVDQGHVDIVKNWREHPESFVKDMFGVTPDKWQADALNSLNHHDKVSIRSGHGVGKSAFLAWAMIWWLYTRYPAKIACTAPTSHQLDDVLWGEVAKWTGKMDTAWSSLLDVKKDRIELKSNPRESFAVARTARKENPEALQGFHSENMLFIIDEASGVDDVIFQVGQGAMSTIGAKTLMAANPTRTSGYFFDSHHIMRDVWKTFRVSCADASMVDQSFVDDMLKQYGEESNVYRVRVLGDFPTDEDDSVISLGLVEDAVTREVSKIPGDVVWGLDVARFGDDRSALAKRQKNTLLEPVKTWAKLDLMQTVGKVVHEYETSKEKPTAILVDVIGLGAGVVDRLREVGLPVRGVNVGEAASVKDKFMRFRDELWWRAREFFEDRSCKIPDDPTLISELVQPKYEINSTGKILVENKDKLKKRGLKSPDAADAFLLTLAYMDVGTSPNKRLNYSNEGIV